MSQLKHTKIYRGGATASSLTFESDQCSAEVDEEVDTLNIKFSIASKGGGTTDILLVIGEGDFQTILQEIASKIPQSVGVLSDCASIANKKNLESLVNAWKARNYTKARAESLINDLKPVEHFVELYLIDKYDHKAKISEEDEQLLDQIKKVMNSLREF